jgi:hypothetical protein
MDNGYEGGTLLPLDGKLPGKGVAEHFYCLFRFGGNICIRQGIDEGVSRGSATSSMS